MPPLDNTPPLSSSASSGLISLGTKTTENISNNSHHLSNYESPVSNCLLEAIENADKRSTATPETKYPVSEFNGRPVLDHATLKQLSDNGHDFMVTIPYKRTFANQVQNIIGRELDKEMMLQQAADEIRLSGQPGSVRNLKYALGSLYPDYKELRSAGVLETLNLYKEKIGTGSGRKLLNVLMRQLSPRALNLNSDGNEKKADYMKKPSPHPSIIEREAAKDDAKREYLSEGVRAYVLSELVSPDLRPTWSEAIDIYKILRDHVPVSSSIGESQLTRCMLDAIKQYPEVSRAHRDESTPIAHLEWENTKRRDVNETRMAQPELPLLTAIMQFVSSDRTSAKSKQAVAHAFIMHPFYRREMSFPSNFVERRDWTTQLLRHAYPNVFDNWHQCKQVYEFPDPQYARNPPMIKLEPTIEGHRFADYLIHEFENGFRLRDGSFVGSPNQTGSE